MSNLTSDNSMPGCPVCGLGLSLSSAVGRKSGKPFIMMKCPKDGRHFRAFITDREYVTDVTTRLEQLGSQDVKEQGPTP